MSENTLVSPPEETLNQSAELTNEPAEIVTPPVDETAPAEPSESEESKALKRMQRRIDKRTADVYRERAEKEQLAQRITELERRQQPQDDKQHQADPQAIEAKAQALAQEITQQQKFRDSVSGVLKAGNALPKFAEACNALNEELPFYERTGNPTPFLAAVLDFDAPAQLLHHLGTNPDLAAELADLTPTRLVRRLDAIERELADKAKPKTSNAPKPLEPVKGTGGTKEPSDMSDAEFASWRRRQIAQRR